MELKKIKFEKTTSIISFLFVFTVFISCLILIFTKTQPQSIVPYSIYFVPAVHALCAVLSFIMIFKFYYPIMFFMLQLESAICILTNFEILGIFFYYIAVFLIFIIYYQTKPVKYVVCICYSIHLLLLLFTINYGWPRFVIDLFTSFYMMAIYLWLYNLLKVRFSCFKPSMIMSNSTIGDRIPGTVLKLSEFELTERQVNFILDYVNNNLSYNDLTEKYYVSLSTVKKEFAEVFKVFGVTKNDELKLLLLQYVVEK